MRAVPVARTRAVQVKSKARIVDKRRQPASFSVIPASAMLGMLPLSINVTVSAKTIVAASLSLPALVNIDFELDGFATLGNAFARLERRGG